MYLRDSHIYLPAGWPSIHDTAPGPTGSNAGPVERSFRDQHRDVYIGVGDRDHYRPEPLEDRMKAVEATSDHFTQGIIEMCEPGGGILLSGIEGDAYACYFGFLDGLVAGRQGR